MSPNDVKDIIQGFVLNKSQKDFNVMSFTFIKKGDPNFDRMTNLATKVSSTN